MTIEKDISVFRNYNNIEDESGFNKTAERSGENTKYAKTTFFGKGRNKSKMSPNQSNIKKHEISNCRSYRSNTDFHKRNEDRSISRDKSQDISVEKHIDTEEQPKEILKEIKEEEPKENKVNI